MTALCPLAGCGRPSQDGGVCAQDVWRLRQDLRSVPGLLADLHATMGRMSKLGPAAEKVDGKGESPVFFHQQAADALRALEGELRRWATVVHGDRAWTAAAAAGALAGAMEGLRCRGDAGPLWDGLQGAAARARRAVDTPAMRTVIPVGPCPEDGCAGAVRAFIPADDRPGHMACDSPEAPHSWTSGQFYRAGKRIRELAERKARERRAS